MPNMETKMRELSATDSKKVTGGHINGANDPILLTFDPNNPAFICIMEVPTQKLPLGTLFVD